MSIEEVVRANIRSVLRTPWSKRDGLVVPKTEDVALGGGAVKLEAAFLYADMAGSTRLAQTWLPDATAKVIRCFLDATCRVIRAEAGHIRSFDGDRVMAIFIGDGKCSTAARCALQINHAISEILHDELKDYFNDMTDAKKIGHCTGVDVGEAMIVRGGVRGSNDLVSIGTAPNVAAKLSGVRNGYPSIITEAVYTKLNQDSKIGADGRDMWARGSISLGEAGYRTVYQSNWWWRP